MQSRNRSDAILTISSDEDSNASLAGNLSEAGTWKRFLHLGGGAAKDSNAKVPCIPPASLIPEEYGELAHEKYMVSMTLCKRDLVLSCTGQMVPQRSRKICVNSSVTTQQHEKTSCALETLAFPLRKEKKEGQSDF